MQLYKRIFIIIIILAASLMQLAAREFVVVIDAGHGGKDYGAVGALSREKDINLKVALKLGEMIERSHDDVKVVYTRKTDKFISLQERADIANRAGGDLFISIHTNSAPETSKNRLNINGASVYVLGRKSEENLAVAQRENSVIMLEDDYKTNYAGFDPNSPESYIAFELIQDRHMEHSLQAARSIQEELVESAGRKDNGVRQAMFWVLVKTGMPAVLVELDFICNPKQDRYLGSEAGQTQLAESIFNGFKVYKSGYDKEVERLGSNFEKSKPASQPAISKPQKKVKDKGRKTVEKEASPSPTAKSDDSNATIYKVQFYVSRQKLSAGDRRLKDFDDVDYYVDGGVYKYTSGASESLDEINKHLKEVKKKYSDAFVITTRGGKRIK